MQTRYATAFGLTWSSDLDLWQFLGMEKAPVADIVVSVLSGGVADRVSVMQHRCSTICRDGFRFSTKDEAVFDIYGNDRITITPLERWDGVLPLHFFGTTTAALLALRGLVPMHGTAVEMNGKAVLLCGRSGAGKSTLGVNLISMGGRLISDDLTALRAEPGGRVQAVAGRPGIRLHPDAAKRLRATLPEEAVKPSAFGKIIAFPPRVAPATSYPIAGIVRLGGTGDAFAAAQRFAWLCAQSFRPRLMHLLPGHAARMAALAGLVQSVPLLHLPGLQNYSDDGCRDGAETIRRWFDKVS